jgi:SAM-dependent methyltransferase
MAGLILSHLRNYDTPLKDINVLEIAPGNGCLGALLNSYNVSNIIGIDNNTAAKEASLRDYPTVYKEYLVSDDITQLASDDKKHPDFDCIICCSALDFNHVNLDSLLLLFDKKLKPGGICAVNIRNSDIPGCIKNTFFKRLAELEESDALQVATNFEYVHRADVYGNPIDYLAVVLRKTK